MKVPEGMAEVLEEYYMYEYILTLIKYIYGIILESRCWFKHYIKTMTQKVVYKNTILIPVFYTEWMNSGQTM